MATPSDDKKAAAKKTVTKTAAKKPTATKKTTKAPAKVAAKKAPAKKAVKKSAPKDASSSSVSSASKPLNFDFSDSVQVEAPRAKTTQKSDGLDKAKEHAERAFEELSTAAVVGLDHVTKKLDAASVKARREAKEALQKGEQWVKEHPVAASVAGSAVAGTVTAAFKKLFKR